VSLCSPLHSPYFLPAPPLKSAVCPPPVAFFPISCRVTSIRRRLPAAYHRISLFVWYPSQTDPWSIPGKPCAAHAGDYLFDVCIPHLFQSRRLRYVHGYSRSCLPMPPSESPFSSLEPVPSIHNETDPFFFPPCFPWLPHS